MAEQRRRTSASNRYGDSRRYRTSGNVAYQPEYERNAYRRQDVRRYQEPVPEQPRKPKIQPRKRVHKRPQAEVRAQERVSLFAVVGSAVVLVSIMVLVMLTAQLAVANNDIVELRNELTELQEEGQQLQAQHEQVFDLEMIEEMFLSSGAMVRPSSDQMVYMNLAQTDSVIYYSEAPEGLNALIQQATDFLDGFLGD